MSNEAVFLLASKCIHDWPDDAAPVDVGAGDGDGEGQALVGHSPASASTVTIMRVFMAVSSLEGKMLLHIRNVENVQSIAVWCVDLETSARGYCDIFLSADVIDHGCRVATRSRLEVPEQLAGA